MNNLYEIHINMSLDINRTFAVHFGYSRNININNIVREVDFCLRETYTHNDPEVSIVAFPILSSTESGTWGLLLLSHAILCFDRMPVRRKLLYCSVNNNMPTCIVENAYYAK